MKEKVLYLPLQSQWFEAIVHGDKREEYRKITPFWVKRLFEPTTEFAKKKWSVLFGKALYESSCLKFEESVIEAVNTGVLKPKDFSHVEFTMGYPKKDDKERRKRYKIEGFYIGFGHPTWGAPTERVFIIGFE